MVIILNFSATVNLVYGPLFILWLLKLFGIYMKDPKCNTLYLYFINVIYHKYTTIEVFLVNI